MTQHVRCRWKKKERQKRRLQKGFRVWIKTIIANLLAGIRNHSVFQRILLKDHSEPVRNTVRVSTLAIMTGMVKEFCIWRAITQWVCVFVWSSSTFEWKNRIRILHSQKKRWRAKKWGISGILNEPPKNLKITRSSEAKHWFFWPPGASNFH